MSDVKRYIAVGEFTEAANSKAMPFQAAYATVVLASDYDALAQRCRELEALLDEHRRCNHAAQAWTNNAELRAKIERLRNPTDDMLVAGQEVWAMGRIGPLEDCEEAKAIYLAMIKAAELQL